jgi:hypothetical protein
MARCHGILPPISSVPRPDEGEKFFHAGIRRGSGFPLVDGKEPFEEPFFDGGRFPHEAGLGSRRRTECRCSHRPGLRFTVCTAQDGASGCWEVHGVGSGAHLGGEVEPPGRNDVVWGNAGRHHHRGAKVCAGMYRRRGLVRANSYSLPTAPSSLASLSMKWACMSYQTDCGGP